MNFFKFVAVFAVLSLNTAFAQHQIIPTPASTQERTGQLFFESTTISINKKALSSEAFVFFEKEFQLLGLQLQESNNGTIQFKQNPTLKSEGYILDIDSLIVIEASDASGHFYGMMSLLQRIGERKHTVYVQKVRIEDAPAFQWRGLHLDVSRHFFTVDEVKRFLDLMALYKFNTFHWHLTDDQGWRIEIKKYPKLTSVGGYRDSTVIGHYSDSPRRYDTNKYGGFYTQAQIKEVVAYAKMLQIDVVPEIEMPGHARAALAAYPELSCSGEQMNVVGLWGVFDEIFCSKESTIVFLQNVLDEVIALFPSQYIHIGGDEAPKVEWNKCDECHQVMEANGLHDAHELQSYFIGRMDTYLTAKGKKLIGWDEILEGGLSPNAAVMSWRGEEGGIEAAKQSHYVVMTPTTYCYFDYYQSGHSSEPLAIGGYLPLEKVYNYSPVPEGLTPEQSQFILGGQANLWTEYVPNFKQVEYMVYPRALAMIQSLWCEEKPNYKAFLKTYVDDQDSFLKKHKVNAAPSIYFPALRITRIPNGIGLNWSSLDSNAIFDVLNYKEGFSDLGTPYQLSKNDVFAIKATNGISDGPSIFELKSKQLDGLMMYSFNASAALGKPLNFVTAPHAKYNHNGSLNLVDGILGRLPWKGSEWIGFLEPKIEMVLDLEKVESISSISMGFLNSNGSWIYLPEELKVEVSTDGKNWSVVSTLQIAETASKIYRPDIPCEIKGRYLRLQITTMETIPEGKDGAGTVPWTFIDEIQIETK